MPGAGPFDLVCRMAEILEELGIAYALGGSMASSLLGEPRSTVDVDIAVRLDTDSADALIERVSASFYVPVEAARDAVRNHSAFNLVDTTSALKVDLFVAGDGLLDRMQLERRIHIQVPGAPNGIWITAPEDQVLRKLDWFRRGASLSDRQWRDVVGILRVHRDSMDLDYLTATARAVYLSDELATALREAESPGDAT